ncbi:hypothetical protein GA0070617_2456 [Micromonospora yangpuensis]|uniref:Integrin beta 3 n=1 Tax=Micromonospora yangpuensis TaxID=683228 RepID=A0A1C6UIG9_9ACTN|nr:hypothetical protein GA0070617_2456 [Micromonospora yangpuensis]
MVPPPAVARAAAPVRPTGDERPAGRATPPQREPDVDQAVAASPVRSQAAGVARVAAAAPVTGPGGPRPATPGGVTDEPDAEQARDEAAERTATAGDGAGGARSELRRRLRERRRLRLGLLALVSVLVLGALPLYFGIRTLSRDPVFDTLDALGVPGWAAVRVEDDVSGSRWCLLDCRLRERTVESERPPAETAQAYEQALAADGWRPWKVDRCPEQPANGSYTCWRRDELTLDLWVREPTCVPPPVDGEPAIVPSPAPQERSAECSGSSVSLKVRNAIDDDRTRPQPSTDPSLTGEDPYPTLTEDPLGEPTPSPS